MEDDVEQFSLILMGIIFLIIVYTYVGTLFEHKQVYAFL